MRPERYCALVCSIGRVPRVPYDDDPTFEPGDLIDLAVLGMARDEPVPLDDCCEAARELCHPWLAPTCELVLGRIGRLVAAGHLAMPASAAAATALQATSTGRACFAHLMQRPLAAPTHDLRFCAENLKLAFLPGLDEPLRSRVSADMLAARRRCMACVERQLVACGEERPLLRACLDRQRRLMSAELEVMGAEIAGAGPP